MKRRKFLEKTMAGTAGVALGTAGLELASCSSDDANDKVILALIGTGDRGTQVLVNTCKVNENVEVKYLCDVNEVKLGKCLTRFGSELGYQPATVKSMKAVFDDQDIDAVIIATPEHWHALATIWACQAGKDVYVEKNPTLNIWEGRKIIEAAEKYKRIVQIGFQNRSAPYGYTAQQFIKEGKLGKIIHVKSYNMLGGRKWHPQEDTPVPEGLDWDAWLGPAPARQYNPGIHDMEQRGGWNNYWAYSGGKLADDASHVMDLARLVLGNPGHPPSVYCCGGNWAWGSECEVPEIQVITYNFEDFTMTCESGNATNYMKKTPGEIRQSNSKLPDWSQNATRTEIYGSEGMMYLGRHGGGWQAFGENEELLAQEYGLFPDSLHQQNFIDCVRTRKQPNGNVLQGHLSAVLVHLGNIASRIGEKHLIFDGEKELFTNSEEANQLLKYAYREPYVIPEKV